MYFLSVLDGVWGRYFGLAVSGASEAIMAIRIPAEHYGGFMCFLGGMFLTWWGEIGFWFWLFCVVGLTAGGFFTAIIETYDTEEQYGSDIGQQIRRKKILECVFAVVLGLVFGWWMGS